jgi:glycogen(starch) synthase
MTADCVGGVWTYALQLAKVLARDDVEVVLVTMGRRPSRDQAREATGLENVRLISTDLKLEWEQDPDDDLDRANDLLLDVEANFRPDIVHINGYANARAGFAAPTIAVAHSCVPTWWQACYRCAVPHEWQRYETRLRDGIASVDCVVAPTRAYLDEFIVHHGRPRRSEVIHNGRDSRDGMPQRKRHFALAAGRLWDEAKNIGAVVRAAERIGASIVIAGDGARPDNLPPNVAMVGKLSQDAMVGTMAAATAFLSPARYEPFGLAILEAARAGCALVLGDIPTLRELWDGAADFVDPEDHEALAAAASRLLSDSQAARQQGTLAAERAARYGAQAMSSAYLTLYRDLLSQRPSAARPTQSPSSRVAAP